MIALAGCVPPQPVVAPRPIDVTADPREYAAFQQGALSLAGQAFLTTRGGDVKLAAGRVVTLDPATTYAREWFRRFGADLATFERVPPDSLFQAARRTTTANAEGRFRFDRLAPGDYIVRTTVTWETGDRYAGLQGGVVASLVTVGDAPLSEVVVNQVITPNTAAILGVRFATDEELRTRRFETVARASGTSCKSGLLEAAPTEAVAREQLIVDAATKDADAVGNVQCARHGMSLSPNCSSRIVCEGDAIRWLR